MNKVVFGSILILTLSLQLTSCQKKDTGMLLPDGYKMWVMNADEIYLSNKKNELIAGPSLRKLGISRHYIVVFCDNPRSDFIGIPKTVGYGVVDSKTGVFEVETESSAKIILEKRGDLFPQMVSYSQFKNAAEE